MSATAVSALVIKIEVKMLQILLQDQKIVAETSVVINIF